MSFFDAAERGALTLTLSRSDPFDADYLTVDGVPLYRVRTRKKHRAGTGFGYLDTYVTSVQRRRADPPSTSSTSTNVPMPTINLAAVPTPVRRRSMSSRRRTQSTIAPLDTIDEVADAEAEKDGHEGRECDAESTTVDDRSDSDMILVATIERRPFSMSPVRLRFNGRDGPASDFLRRERAFSSARCFLSITGDLLKWQLSTPTPKLYNSNKTRIAKYCRPFLPSKGLFSPTTAVFEIAEGIESDKALDEIVVSLLLAFLL